MRRVAVGGFMSVAMHIAGAVYVKPPVLYPAYVSGWTGDGALSLSKRLDGGCRGGIQSQHPFVARDYARTAKGNLYKHARGRVGAQQRRSACMQANPERLPASFFECSSTKPNTLQELLEDAHLLSELRTDDGYLVTEITTSFGGASSQAISRSNWVRDLLTTFSSQILSQISQRLTITTAWSAYIAAVNLYGDEIAPAAWEITRYTVPGWPHELVGGFLSILVVFRTDQAYGRFWEARRHWAACSSTTKSVARMALANLPPPLAYEFIALLAMFPTALKQHLRGYVDRNQLIAIYKLYQPTTVLSAHAATQGGQSHDSPYLEAVLDSKNMPMTITLFLSCLAAPLRDRPAARVFNYEFLWEELEDKISKLTHLVSACEKLKCTPIPLSYSRHTSRFFSLFLFSLPIVLVKQASPLLVVGIITAVSWVLFATDEIGHIIEEPFGTLPEGAILRPTKQIAQGNLRAVFKALGPDASGSIDVSSLANLQQALDAAQLDQQSSFTLAELERLGAIGGDMRLDFEAFRMLWALTAGEVRADRLESLPLSQMCDAINRDLFALWASQRRAMRTGLLGDAVDLDGDALGRLMLAAAPSGGGEGAGEVTGVEGWSVGDVEEWLQLSGLRQFSRTFRDNDINGATLVSLDGADLASMRISSQADQQAILQAVAVLLASDDDS